MILQCPDCGVKLRPKPPAGTRPGAKVALTCPCGSKLRFTMPRTPSPFGQPQSGVPIQFDSALAKAFDEIMGPGYWNAMAAARDINRRRTSELR